MNRTDQLIDEIRQIIEQYRKEVSSRRGAWPLSIKERVIELRGLGLTSREVFKRTGVPEPTVWLWTSDKSPRKKKDASKFIPISVSSTVKSLTVKSKEEEPSFTSKESLIVELPGGLRVQGMSLDTLVLLSRRLSS